MEIRSQASPNPTDQVIKCTVIESPDASQRFYFIALLLSAAAGGNLLPELIKLRSFSFLKQRTSSAVPPPPSVASVIHPLLPSTKSDAFDSCGHSQFDMLPPPPPPCPSLNFPPQPPHIGDDDAGGREPMMPLACMRGPSMISGRGCENLLLLCVRKQVVDYLWHVLS